MKKWTKEELEEYYQMGWDDAKSGDLKTWPDTARRIAYDKGSFDYWFKKREQ
jgi:hypothetical protein